VITIEARAAFLRKIHLFHDVSDENLAVIAGILKEERFAAGETIFSQGSVADRFYIVSQGRVKITEVSKNQERELAQLVGGDYFGERALLAHGAHTALALAMERSYLFSIPADEFYMLLKKFSRLRAALDMAVESRKLAFRLNFSWLRPQEVIYFLARKHTVLLVRALSGPAIALLLPVFLLSYFFLTRSFFAIFAGGLSLLIIAAWAVWNWVDWGNDYYILTSQRVIWVERVVFLYDSRQEAPLSTILSVGVETDQLGRLLDYGEVLVRTYTGKIPFSHVPHPNEAANLIEEHRARTRRAADNIQKEAMRNVLRQKMGLTVETKVDESEKQDVQAMPTFYRRSVLQVIGSNWFKLRLEDSGTITYRKHWFVLLKKVLAPSVLILIILLGMLARLITLARTPDEALIDLSNGVKIDTTILALPVLLLPLVLWWVYRYVDWRNDIYQVTPDQVIDISRKPLGTEQRRSAPLENILSTEAERIGFTGYLLNYGTVFITVGGTHLDFEDLMDPASVQADIDRRRETRQERKREAEAAAERERMSAWLMAYYENEPELRRQQAASDNPPAGE
jgi:CRP-like cAMP-binding protein